jgi:hypothetical protein
MAQMWSISSNLIFAHLYGIRSPPLTGGTVHISAAVSTDFIEVQPRMWVDLNNGVKMN